jgi:hypothetical protein
VDNIKKTLALPSTKKKCKNFSWQITYQEENFASGFLENAQAILHFRLSFHLSMRQDFQELEESISVIKIYD